MIVKTILQIETNFEITNNFSDDWTIKKIKDDAVNTVMALRVFLQQGEAEKKEVHAKIKIKDIRIGGIDEKNYTMVVKEYCREARFIFPNL